MSFQISIRDATPLYRPQPRPTTCYTGYSCWHLIALGIFPEALILEFARTVFTISSDELLEDLRESTWLSLPEIDYKQAFWQRHGFELDRANRLILYRNVKQLCQLTGVPLFGYFPIPPRDMHPVVKAFNACLDIPSRGGHRPLR